jgi:arginyl-tRNA synthetase
MINAETLLFDSVQKALSELYALQTSQIIFQKTRKEFEGDFTLVTFPYTKETKKSPEILGAEIGAFISENNPDITAFNVVKGFLNISLSTRFGWRILIVLKG